MNEFGYGFAVTTKLPLEDARKLVTTTLSEEGFGVVVEVDMQAAFEKKLGDKFRPYSILGACNPELARQALEADPHLGLLLPCNIVLQEAEGGTMVSIASPRALFASVRNPEIEPLVTVVEQRLRRVLDALQ